MLVLMAVLIAGSAMAERVEGPGVPNIIGAIETPVLDSQTCFVIEADGSEFYQMAGPLSGSIYAVEGNFTMLFEGVSATWCSDFCVLFGNADLSEIYIQVGGFTTYGATLLTLYGWNGSGSTGAAGTIINELVDLGGSYDLGDYYMFMGNGYSGGGINTWEGCVDFMGDAVANESISMGSIKALYR